MKTNFLLSIFLATGVPVMAQNVVKVGKGSYAAYTPLNLCYSEDHKSDDWGFKGDKSRDMQVRKIFQPTIGGPISSPSSIRAISGLIHRWSRQSPLVWRFTGLAFG